MIEATIKPEQAARISRLAELDRQLELCEKAARKAEEEANRNRQECIRIKYEISSLKHGLKPGVTVIVRRSRRNPKRNYLSPPGQREEPFMIETKHEAVVTHVGVDCAMSCNGRGTLWVKFRLANGELSQNERKLHSWDAWELKD